MLVASTSVVGFGFRSGKLRTSKCLPICPRYNDNSGTPFRNMRLTRTSEHAGSLKQLREPTGNLRAEIAARAGGSAAPCREAAYANRGGGWYHPSWPASSSHGYRPPAALLDRGVDIARERRDGARRSCRPRS